MHISVHLHYLSPLSRGLFQRAVGHSGSALNPWVMVERAAEKAKLIATGAGCPVDASSSSKELLQCLRQLPAEVIVRQVPKLQDFLYNPYSPLGVVVEQRGKYNPAPFLTEHPRDLTRSGRVAKVPLLLSVTEAEGLYPAAEFLSNASYLRHINDHWNEVLPSILDYKYAVRDGQLRDALSQVIRERYLGANELNERVFPQFVRVSCPDSTDWKRALELIPSASFTARVKSAVLRWRHGNGKNDATTRSRLLLPRPIQSNVRSVGSACRIGPVCRGAARRGHFANLPQQPARRPSLYGARA